MRCDRILKLLALFAGAELSRKKAGRIAAHLEACPSCRREAAGMAAALRAAKALARTDEVEDWSEPQWRSMMREITSSRIARKRILAGPAWKPVLAGAVALLLVVSGAYFFLKRSSEPSSVQTALRTPSQSLTAPVQPPERGDGKSKTIISKESGLKIIWFYNKDFQGEGYGK
jgi:anti-sigma factor RsiW